MENETPMTRRALLKVVPAASAAMAMPLATMTPALGKAFRASELPQVQMEELLLQLKADAQVIDPSITGIWVGYDHMLPPTAPVRAFCIYFDRKAGNRFSHKPERDPLLDAIAAYRAGTDDFNRNAPDDDDAWPAYVEVSYGPPMRVLEQWGRPATSAEAALAALSLLNEDQHLLSDMAEAMFAAVEGYLRTASGLTA